MLVEVKVPKLAESIPDATLMTWHKQPGEAVARGENLIDLETDKVTLEVTAPEAGVVKEIRKTAGETVLSDEVLAVIDTDGVPSVAGPDTRAQKTAPALAGTAAVEPPPAQEPTAVPPPPPEQATADTPDRKSSAPQPAADPGTAPAQAPKLSPAVRKLVVEKGLDPAAIPHSGARITKADIVGYLETPKRSDSMVQARAEPVLSAGQRPEERVPMTRLRKRAAERLLAAQHEAAILTTFNEVDMHPIMELRGRYKTDFEQRHGVKLGFMSFFVKAAVAALKSFPLVNASIDGEDVLYHGYFDIGIAVSAPRGLVVPILRDADTLSFAEIEASIRDFGERATRSALTMEDLSGGTFTITNGGIFGSLLSTPILNPPQSAILGMHKIQDRPVVAEGQIVIRSMMYLALSYDHRIIDGREAVQFLVAIKEQIEDPARMLLQV